MLDHTGVNREILYSVEFEMPVPGARQRLGAQPAQQLSFDTSFVNA